MEKTNWYAVFTASRAEKRVKERLEQAGIENYLPVRKVEFERNGQVRRLEIPVITGCIFNWGRDCVVKRETGPGCDFGRTVG